MPLRYEVAQMVSDVDSEPVGETDIIAIAVDIANRATERGNTGVYIYDTRTGAIL